MGTLAESVAGELGRAVVGVSWCYSLSLCHRLNVGPGKKPPKDGHRSEPCCAPTVLCELEAAQRAALSFYWLLFLHPEEPHGGWLPLGKQ